MKDVLEEIASYLDERIKAKFLSINSKDFEMLERLENYKSDREIDNSFANYMIYVFFKELYTNKKKQLFED